jgi:hypothetical protein
LAFDNLGAYCDTLLFFWYKWSGFATDEKNCNRDPTFMHDGYQRLPSDGRAGADTHVPWRPPGRDASLAAGIHTHTLTATYANARAYARST